MGHDEYEELEEVEEFEEAEEDLAFSLTDQFYIRRNGKVKGPMDAKRIRKLVKSKKLKPSDQVSLSVDGSWDRLSKAYKDIMSGTYVDSTSAKLPPKRKKKEKEEKISKPLADVECLGNEGQIARMAMYQTYRKHLYLVIHLVILTFVVGVPLSWTMGTNFWGKAYNNPSSFNEPDEADKNPKLNSRNYLKITKGMSPSQVKILLGKPDDPTGTQHELLVRTGRMGIWTSGSKTIWVFFDEDGVSDMNQEGLD